VAAEKTVVFGIGVDNQTRRTPLLCDECLHASEVLTVAHDHNAAAHVYLHLIEFLEIFRRAVICVHDISFDVAGRRHTVVSRDHTRIILEGIAVDVLALWAVHLDAIRGSHVDTDLGGIIDPGSVLDDLGLKPGLTKLSGNVFGCSFVFRGTRQVWGLSQSTQMRFRGFRVRHGEKAFLDGVFRVCIVETEDRGGGVAGLSGRLCDCLGIGRTGEKKSENKDGRKKEFHRAPVTDFTFPGLGTREVVGKWTTRAAMASGNSLIPAAPATRSMPPGQSQWAAVRQKNRCYGIEWRRFCRRGILPARWCPHADRARERRRTSWRLRHAARSRCKEENRMVQFRAPMRWYS